MKVICRTCNRKFKNAHALHVHQALAHQQTGYEKARLNPKPDEVQKKEPSTSGISFTVDQLIYNLRLRITQIEMAIRELEDFTQWMSGKEGPPLE